MPTRAIKVWNASASAWESVGIEAPAGGGAISYQAASPTSPVIGQIWVESDVDLTSFDLNQYLTQANASATYIADSIVNAKGDLITATANDTPNILTAGSNGQMLMVDSSATAGLRYVDPPANRNLLINGAMQVAQRSTSLASIPNGGYSTVDRWRHDLSAATWTQSVENDAPTGSGFRKSLKMLCTAAKASLSAGDYISVEQGLEGQDVQRITKGTSSAQQLTVSFWVKSNATGIYVVELRDNDNSRQVCGSYTVSASGTWERKTITFPADTTGALDNDNGNSLRTIFWLAAGTTYASGTLSATWESNNPANRAVGQTNLAAATNNYWQITGVQLETGPVATPFEFEPYETTLRKCQRYFWRLRSSASEAYSWLASGGFGVNTTIVDIPVRLPVSQRSSSTTMTVSSAVAASDSAIRYSTGTWTVIYKTPDIVGVRYTHGSASITALRHYGIQIDNSTSAYIDFADEL